MDERKDLDKDRLPIREGVYLTKGGEEIDVYYHPIKGFCVFAEDIMAEGAGVNDETDCHVSIQFTGLEFISKVRDL